MLHKSKFESILHEIRNDYENIRKLQVLLQSKVQKEPIDEDTKTWIMDVYLDKVYELNKKLHLLFRKIDTPKTKVELDNALQRFVKSCHNLAYPHSSANQFDKMYDPMKHAPRDIVTNELNNFIGEIEWCFSELRKSNWKELAGIKPLEFTNLPRRKYVTAREEIEK
jgi:hypothetical protein